MKDEGEVPIVFLGKVKKFVNSNIGDRKAVFVFITGQDQFNALHETTMSSYAKAYKDIDGPTYLPFNGENVIVKAAVIGFLLIC